MAKRSHPRHGGVAAEPAPDSAAASVARTIGKTSPGRRVSWRLRFGAMILVPLAAFVVLEGTLRLFHYGSPTTYFVRADRDTLTTNPKFAWQFYPRDTATAPVPLLVKKAKPAGTKRVLVLGESAAAGTPDPAFSFSRILELMLAERFPGQPVEIINVAMRGIDSHIVRRIMNECVKLSPDLVVVYMGNNDVIGLHSPDPTRPVFFARPGVIALQHTVKRTRAAQLTESILRGAIKKERPQQDMEFLRKQRMAFDDPKREIIYANHRRNLDKICRSAVAAGANVIVCSMAVNLRDFPPLGSLNRRGLTAEQLVEWQTLYSAGAKAESENRTADALKQFRAAAVIDDHHAELHFRIARCAESLGYGDEAPAHYMLARDWDALQFRSDRRINGNIREVAARWGTNHVRFVDVEKAFAHSRLSENGLPGSRLFQEHVHFFFDGDHELATTLLPDVEIALGLKSPKPVVLDRNACAKKLGYTPIEEANIYSAVAQLSSKPPFLDQVDHGSRQAVLQRRAAEAFKSIDRNTVEQTRQIYTAALKERPSDWMLRLNYARLLSDLGEYPNAAGEFEKVTALFPMQKSLRMLYATALAQAKRPNDAIRELEAILKIDAAFSPALKALEMLKRK